MSIQLTTPFDPGDIDADGPYTHVEISRLVFNLASRSITIHVARGRLVAGSFVSGVLDPVVVVIADNPRAGTADYTDIMAALPGGGTEPVSSGVARLSYTHLLTKGYFSGIPVDPNA